ncbi:MAG: Type 1 glutamine amidotransferase-like domain-containing protein [Candidatus Moraniibacteriota bacterium]
MKTKFILHGGFDLKKTNSNNTDFYTEILKDAPENAEILLVPFARETDTIPAATNKVIAELNKIKKQHVITINIAREDNFLEQVRPADVVYFHGGVSLKLLKTLRKYPDLREFLKGKIVAGESAGANVLCKFFFSPHADDVFEGLGIVPVKIIPHYKKEYEGRIDHVGADVETLLLPEYTYKIFYQDL